MQVVFAHPEQQLVVDVELHEGATMEEAIRTCGILAKFPDLDLARAAIGVFGERVNLSDPVHEGDRVEIYRPLIADPKEARRRRARRRRSA